jgi:hypothetical protein
MFLWFGVLGFFFQFNYSTNEQPHSGHVRQVFVGILGSNCRGTGLRIGGSGLNLAIQLASKHLVLMRELHLA